MRRKLGKKLAGDRLRYSGMSYDAMQGNQTCSAVTRSVHSLIFRRRKSVQTPK